MECFGNPKVDVRAFPDNTEASFLCTSVLAHDGIFSFFPRSFDAKRWESRLPRRWWGE